MADITLGSCTLELPCLVGGVSANPLNSKWSVEPLVCVTPNCPQGGNKLPAQSRFGEQRSD